MNASRRFLRVLIITTAMLFVAVGTAFATAQTPILQEPLQTLLPASGSSATYVLTRSLGGGAIEVGRVVQTWTLVKDQYRIEAVTKTTGVAALFKSLRITHTSLGRVDGSGLVPISFVSQRSDGKPSDLAEFDWVKQSVRIYRGEMLRKEEKLLIGSQDVLSQFFQLGLRALPIKLEGMITTGKNYYPFVLERHGEEMLETSRGPVKTMRYASRPDPKEKYTEVWLSQDAGHWPLRIRQTETDGTVYEQQAIEWSEPTLKNKVAQ